MALIIINRADVPYEGAVYLADRNDVQKKFCSALENEGVFDERPFLTSPDITEYLAAFGITYTGHYTFKSDEWEKLCGSAEKFVTFLNYSLQISCLALYYDMSEIILGDSYLYELEYLLPVLRKRDIYIAEKNYRYVTEYAGAAKSGAEVRIAGRSSLDMSEKEFFGFLLELEEKASYLDRETDARVFPADYKEKYIFEPSEMSLKEYLVRNDGSYKPEKGKHENIRVLSNGRNLFTGIYRRYPIHYLFLKDGKWKYASRNSVKNPTLEELLDCALFTENVFDCGSQRETDVSSAEKVFTLVLNCNETCDVSEYWENAAFAAEYDKKKGTVEFLDLPSGILAFHNILQSSEDLF